jgi:membrane associated rhomboid family serine protease
MKNSALILIILSIAFGVTIGILGALESPAVGTVAMIGGLLLGGLWVIRGLLTRADAKPDR